MTIHSQESKLAVKQWKNPELWELNAAKTEASWQGDGVDNIFLEVIEILTGGYLEFGNEKKS